MAQQIDEDSILTVNMNTAGPLGGRAKFTVYLEDPHLLAVLSKLQSLNGLEGVKLKQIDCDRWDG